MGKDDGGPAFPIAAKDSPQTGPHPGMSLRDYFAAATLRLFSDSESLIVMREQAKISRLSIEDTIAKSTYEIADAMLRERAK